MTDWLFIVYVVVAWGYAPSYPVVRPSEAFCQAERERFIVAVQHMTPCVEADAWQ